MIVCESWEGTEEQLTLETLSVLLQGGARAAASVTIDWVQVRQILDLTESVFKFE